MMSQNTDQATDTQKNLPAERSLPHWLGIVLTLGMVIVVREVSVIVCEHFGMASAGNILGLVVMFMFLFVWRLRRQTKTLTALPEWLTNASNTLLIDSGFAFLPVTAGAGILLFALGDEFWGIVCTLVLSTLIPMWALAKLSDKWLHADNTSSHTHNENSYKQY